MLPLATTPRRLHAEVIRVPGVRVLGSYAPCRTLGLPVSGACFHKNAFKLPFQKILWANWRVEGLANRNLGRSKGPLLCRQHSNRPAMFVNLPTL